MSLLIKGMEMPSGCQPCKLKRFAGNRVLSGCKPEVLYECPFCDGLFALKNKREPSCKFKQLPTPHGRLIDADAHIQSLKENQCGERCRKIMIVLIVVSACIFGLLKTNRLF